jgi:type IV secretion system protein VirB10
MSTFGPDGPERSPVMLAPTPRRGRGVRRLNRVPIMIGVGGACLVAAAIGYTYHERTLQAAANAAQEAEHRPQPANGAAILSGAPVDGEIRPVVYRPPAPPPARQPDQQAGSLPSDHAGTAGVSGEDDAKKAREEAWRNYYAELAELEKDNLAAAKSAMTASTGLGSDNGSSLAGTAATPMPAADTPGLASGAPAASGYSAASAAPPVYGTGVAGYPILPPAQTDAAAQREKQAFLGQPGTTGQSDYLQAIRQAPISSYEVKAGTVIPAVMIGGVNSDVPGTIVGQVAENVYDSATGRYLLIPQGAKLVGTYDNSVSQGQSRVVVVWNRMIYPDASSIDLGAMAGADQAGYGGFHDQVNTHLWGRLGNALLISIAAAGVQLSQPQAVNGQNYNSQQIAAAALGQQFGELGQEYARAGLAIPNTLKIRPGYRFVVMVTKDMVLQPCGGGQDPALLVGTDFGP